ncbi:hypothetical protein CPB83DRAFT_862084 [Crepidotus variabilis]|uniref:Uncharacterized protein n=1 Tax=Crepidotus variabilis TaxID=179855 RepID=A0A9P6JKE8_9AGAR|nr:hypothetical protein CPB83DRAFT_862084 [Crepidotus variabilis]
MSTVPLPKLVRSDAGLDSLPNELLLSVITQACESKESYRTLLLLNRRLHELVTASDFLLKLPIRIDTASVAPFHRVLISNPQFANSITYLWINGPTFKRLGSAVSQDVVMACPQLISLACTTSLLYILGASVASLKPEKARGDKFRNLRELTLFAHDYTSWQTLMESGDTNEWITGQVTHLRLQYRAPPEFADLEEDWFPSLTHYAISVQHPGTISLTREEFQNIFPRDEVEQIIITTFENPEEVNKEVLEWDERIHYGFCVSTGGTEEFSMWAGRASGTDSVWTRGTRYF